MDKNYKFGFLHYWNYFKVNYIISLKSLFEYKSNLYASLFIVLFWDLAIIGFGFFFEDFLSIINFSLADYFLYLFLIYSISNLTWLFLDEKELELFLLRGDFTKFLYIPGNRFLNYFNYIEFNSGVISIGNIVIFLPLILYYGNYSFQYCLLIILVYFLSLLLNIFTLQIINAINFYYYKASQSLFSTFFAVDEINMSYTPLFFEKSKFGLVVVLFQTFFIAKLVLPLFKGEIIDHFWFYILILFGITSTLIIGTLILWHYGLRRYEGYN